MSTAEKVAEQADNMTRWLNDKLLTSEERNNSNINNKSNMNTNANKYNAPATMPNMRNNSNNNNQSKDFDKICKQARAGQKIMIIMRGAPGSGKSTMAKSLVQQTQHLEQYTVKDFVYSSDDYFITKRGYEFNPTLLPEAHDWNKQRVRSKAEAGWSPIIVDNTNSMSWEMMPYVQIAVECGYILELLEPQTSWAKSAGKLAQRCVHQVPRDRIQAHLDRFERTTVPDLIKMLKHTRYTVSLPQWRQEPPLPAVPAVAAMPTPQLVPPQPSAESPSSFRLNAHAQSWVPYEQHAGSYWAQVSGQEMPTPAPSSKSNTNLLDTLRDAQDTRAPVDALLATATEATEDVHQRHSINCPNEASGFMHLRQMYPNKNLTGLWDLYVKCKGDVDWAVDILLKEDELNADVAEYGEDTLVLESADFQCACSGINNVSNSLNKDSQPKPAVASSKIQAKPQRQPRAKRTATAASGNKELQMQIENCFVLSDDQYSDHTRKIRDIRNGILDQPLPVPTVEPPPATDEEEIDAEDQVLLEMELGETLIEQLREHFKWEGDLLPKDAVVAPTKVFMPRGLAKQLYMVWMEAMHNQFEEKRQQTLREDEQFAHLLKHPKYADCTEPPQNMNELLDMELAWSIYTSQNVAVSQAARQPSNDIATRLTKMKLCEKFPNIPKETVLDIFADTGNNYVKTVELLDSDAQCDLTGAQLYEQALRESEKLHAQVQLEQQSKPPKLNSPRSVKSQSPQLHEEAKSAALRDFEETRNMAAHHAQLRAECNHKASQAIQQGSGSVALYYSEIGRLHKQKVDLYNHRAAGCIMEVHKHTQNNPDLLDLHYLHAMEAVSSLDLFLDRHITVLRNNTRVYKNVFIITGRGLHSVNGVSTIKKRVKARLGERRLRWEELNPGLLRVKLYSASKHSTNF
ncbi:CG7139 [Drosophila busckii]|uniref:CG7139 n=1 Tax=Drosophila busckii TaxID=30019 RepID=A0A0M4EYA6_DROBS|nr:CG7139 [Drosophila busckii]